MDVGMASSARVPPLAGSGGEPTWARVHYPKIDYQNAYYYAAPKNTPLKQSLDEVDPKLLETYKKLGIPLHEQMALAGVAVDAVFDSVSVATTFKAALEKAGVIFCPISEAIRDHGELVKKYLGTVVPVELDNFFSTLNSAVEFSDGTFVYVPKGAAHARWNCPPISASTRARRDAVRAHADHRGREGSMHELPRRAAQRPRATRTSFTPPWSNWWRWKARR